MSTLITPEYTELNAQLHQSNPHYGTSSGRWVEAVRDLAGFLGSHDILDYGCGKQRLAAGLPELPVRGYDPAIPGLDVPPAPADLVVCTDVLEHVEPELVDNVLDNLVCLTRKLGLFTVATRPAKKVLVDGRNAHLTQQPIEWWLTKLEARFTVLGIHNDGGQEFLVLVASNAAGVALAPQPQDGWLSVAMYNVSLRLPAALSAGPAEPEALLARAQARRKVGELGEAEVLLRELAAQYPDFPEALIELGQLLKVKQQGPHKTLISADYAQLNTELHARNPQYGTGGQRWAPVVRGLAGWLPTRDILDYGCGKQTLAASLPQLPVRGYDPALPVLNASPEPADLVVCTAVLEHVEPELVENVLDDLARVTSRLGFFTIATRPAVKVLADGRNAHLTQRPIEWWLSKFGERFTIHEHRDYGGQEFYVLVSAPAANLTSPPGIDTLLAAEVAREQELRAKLGGQPDSVELLCELGALLYQQNRLDEAEKLLRRAFQLCPDWFELLHNLGHLSHNPPFPSIFAERIPVLAAFQLALATHIRSRKSKGWRAWLPFGQNHRFVAAECGVYLGSSLEACALLARDSGLNFEFWGLDTFEGLPDLSETDKQFAPVDASYRNKKLFADTALESVAKRFEDRGLSRRINLVKGLFKDTLPSLPDQKFDFVNIDCDLFEPHIECLEYFYPRMKPGGIIFFDDYNSVHYPMAKAAIDRFLEDKSEVLLSLRYGEEAPNHTKVFIIKNP